MGEKCTQIYTVVTVNSTLSCHLVDIPSRARQSARSITPVELHSHPRNHWTSQTPPPTQHVAYRRSSLSVSGSPFPFRLAKIERAASRLPGTGKWVENFFNISVSGPQYLLRLKFCTFYYTTSYIWHHIFLSFFRCKKNLRTAVVFYNLCCAISQFSHNCIIFPHNKNQFFFNFHYHPTIVWDPRAPECPF